MSIVVMLYTEPHSQSHVSDVKLCGVWERGVCLICCVQATGGGDCSIRVFTLKFQDSKWTRKPKFHEWLYF